MVDIFVSQFDNKVRAIECSRLSLLVLVKQKSDGSVCPLSWRSDKRTEHEVGYRGIDDFLFNDLLKFRELLDKRWCKLSVTIVTKDSAFFYTLKLPHFPLLHTTIYTTIYIHIYNNN